MDGEIKRYIAYKLAIGLIKQGKPQLEPDKNDPTRERFHYLTLKDKEINRINLIANVTNKFQSEEKAYIALTIDDGTEQMQVKSFSDNIKLLKDINLGDTILIIGNLRYFNNEIYILPEIVKIVDTRWLLARKLELKKEYGQLYESLESQIKPITETPIAKTKETHIEIKETNKINVELTKQPIQAAKQEIVERQEIHEEKIQTNQEQKQEEQKQENQEQNKPTLREQIIETIKQAEAEEGVDIDKIIMKLDSHTVEEINKIITALLEEGAIYEPRPGRLRIL